MGWDGWTLLNFWQFFAQHLCTGASCFVLVPKRANRPVLKKLHFVRGRMWPIFLRCVTSIRTGILFNWTSLVFDATAASRIG